MFWVDVNLDAIRYSMFRLLWIAVVSVGKNQNENWAEGLLKTELKQVQMDTD